MNTDEKHKKYGENHISPAFYPRQMNTVPNLSLDSSF